MTEESAKFLATMVAMLTAISLTVCALVLLACCLCVIVSEGRPSADCVLFGSAVFLGLIAEWIASQTTRSWVEWRRIQRLRGVAEEDQFEARKANDD